MLGNLQYSFPIEPALFQIQFPHTSPPNLMDSHFSATELELRNDESVDDVVSIPAYKLIAITLHGDSYVRIFREDGGERAERVFDNHAISKKNERKNAENNDDDDGDEIHIFGIVHLYDDVLCSLDSTGTVLIWSASTCDVLCRYHIKHPKSMTKLSESEVAILRKGEINILQYSRGDPHPTVRLRIKEPSAKRIVVMEAHSGVLVTGYEDRDYQAKIWDTSTGALLKTLSLLSEEPYDIAISRRFIAISGDADGSMAVFDRNFKYGLLSDAQLDPKEEADLNFINSNLLLITTSEELLFVQLPSVKVVSVFKPKFAGVDAPKYKSATVLEDGRICVTADDKLFGLFPPPEQVKLLENEAVDDDDGSARKQGGSKSRKRIRENTLPLPEERVQKARVEHLEIEEKDMAAPVMEPGINMDIGMVKKSIENKGKEMKARISQLTTEKQMFKETEEKLRKDLKTKEAQEEKLKLQLAETRKTIEAERVERTSMQEELEKAKEFQDKLKKELETSREEAKALMERNAPKSFFARLFGWGT